MDGELPLERETPGGLSLKFRESWLYSSREPRALPERSALSFSPGERSLVLVFSPLLGYGLELLLSRLPPSSLLLGVEAEPVLHELALRRLPAAVREDPRFLLIQAKSPSDLSPILPRLGEFRRVLPLSLSGGYRLHPEAYDRLLATLDAEVQAAWRNRATLSKLGRLWIRNLIANLASLPYCRAMEGLDEAADTRPVVVAGAGPSLEDAFPWLKRRRDELFLLAVDTALPALRAAGLMPDAVLCLEGQVHNLRDFVGSSRSGIALIADLSAHPVSFRGLGGAVYPIASRFAPCGLLERLEAAGLLPYALPPLGSVGVAALSLALRRWRSSPLIVTGLDFAYERGRIHARGAPSHAARLATMTRLSPDGLYAAALRSGSRPLGSGGRQLSDPVLSAYAELARSELEEFPARVFDARCRGIELGLPPLPGSRTDPRLPPAAPPASRAAEPPRPPAWKDPALVAAFAAAEAERVGELSSALSGERPAEASRLERLIGECDYLYLHFPDRPARPLSDPSFLKRLSVEARSALARWDGLRARLEGGA